MIDQIIAGPRPGDLVRFFEAMLFVAPVCYRIQSVRESEVTLSIGEVCIVVSRAMLAEYGRAFEGAVDWKEEERRFLDHILASTAAHPS